MAASSHPRVNFPMLGMCLILCLTGIGIASATDFIASVTSQHVSDIPTNDDLDPNFYNSTCPQILDTIRDEINAAVTSDQPRMGASLLRLHFHDCFVQGCDASVLLKNSTTIVSEQDALPNVNSLRGFEVIDNIKAKLENLCPGVVSCADILAAVASFSVRRLGGPFWTPRFGRRDSTTANKTEANSDLPSPFLDLDGLITAFNKKGFTQDEMVVLSGAHTIGQGRCLLFRSRIYNESNIDSSFATSLQAKCPQNGGDDNLAPIDVTSPTFFDTAYFRNLLNKTGLFHSDQQLFNGGSTDSKVQEYASKLLLFRQDFANAMIKMGNLSPPPGSKTEIRKVCSIVNGEVPTLLSE